MNQTASNITDTEIITINQPTTNIWPLKAMLFISALTVIVAICYFIWDAKSGKDDDDDKSKHENRTRIALITATVIVALCGASANWFMDNNKTKAVDASAIASDYGFQFVNDVNTSKQYDIAIGQSVDKNKTFSDDMPIKYDGKIYMAHLSIDKKHIAVTYNDKAIDSMNDYVSLPTKASKPKANAKSNVKKETPKTPLLKK